MGVPACLLLHAWHAPPPSQPLRAMRLRSWPAGLVCVSTRRDLDGEEEEEEVEGPALLGEAALLGPARGHPAYHASLRTLTRCLLFRMDASDFAAALRTRPQVGGWAGRWSALRARVEEAAGGRGPGRDGHSRITPLRPITRPAA